MNKKKHVGRPTNEEVVSRKKRKIINFSIIIFCLIILMGGIFLFINRGNLDFSSIMGASISKRMLFVVDGYSTSVGYNYDSIILDTSNLNAYGYTSCKVSNKKKASCEIRYKDYNNSELRVYAKKKGKVNIKVYGKNDNGKSVKKTIKLIIKDYSAPSCYFKEVNSANRGSNSVVIVKCSEKIDYNGFTNDPYGFKSSSLVSLKYDSVSSNSCKYSFNYSDLLEAYVDDVERLTNDTYMLYIRIPKSVCSGKAKIMLKTGLFKDSNGNKNLFPIYSSQFYIY